MTGGPCRTPDCDRIVADAFVCSTCTHRLRVALTDAPELLDELDVDLTRQSRTGQRIGGRSTERPLPFDPTASIVRDALVSTLRTWCLIIDGDLLGTAPADDHLVEHLLGRLERVRHHVEGGQAVDEITAAVSAARDHHLGPDRPGSILAGQCPDCGHAVYAPQDATTARCHDPECDGVVDAPSWRTSAIQALDSEAMTAANTARALTALGHPIDAARIRQWASRGKLHPVWADHLRRPLYLLADVRAHLTTNRKDAS